MRAAWVLSLVACYAPHPPEGAPCSGPDSCPIGQSCVADVCTSHGEPPPDVASLPADAMVVPIDTATPTDAGSCFGTGLVHVCLTTAPSLALNINGPIAFDTDNSPLCQVVQQTTGPDLCVVGVTTANVLPTGIVTVSGARPLVLVSSGDVTISGTIDAASHQGEARGAGAQATCGAGLDGNSGLALGGGGGGAGGSFGALGGSGGKGFDGGPGNAHLGTLPTALVGGCPGGSGGTGTMSAGGPGGSGGAGGGAVYIISTGAITIAGHINASGEGGTFGTFVSPASGGGGGGGAGGMIGLDAPQIAVTGALFANGGGGGGGGGSTAGANGTDGQDPGSAGGTVVGGVGGAPGGGSGGTGFSPIALPGRGGNGSGVSTAGGGGGGGAGIIHVFPAQSVGGTVSPPPT